MPAPDQVPEPTSLLPRPAVKGGTNAQYGPAWTGMHPPDTDPATVDRHPSGIMVEDLMRELEWIDPNTSAVYDYSMDADKAYYLTATSGFYPGEFGFFSRGRQTTNWIGYVAISKPLGEKRKRDIAVVFRGTQAKTEWASDFVWEMQPWSDLQTGRHNVKVAKGFETMYRRFASTPGNTLSIQGQVHVALSKLLTQYGDEIGSITTTGHSLGGALASLCAFDIAWSRINRVEDKPGGALIPVTAFTFEAPRVGNAAYAATFDGDYSPDNPPADLNSVKYVKMLRVVNVPDIVPKAPRTGFRRQFLLPWRWPQLVFWAGATAAGVLIPSLRNRELGYVHGGFEFNLNSIPLEAEGIIRDMRNDHWPCHIKTKIGQWHDLLMALYLIDDTRPIGDLNPHLPANQP
ncbi:hypothetical protein COCSUDRAFT_63967 [Coccomyxa subellipsoidea C-169]|uniref:Fungal lipase-type domain-containing protein n=1 Tax=Coccomyxa subellipsoidea (strain C-169) TaxID=574566 RepID=I0YWS3_COCSC|nr:hypothetical protein COCSUDRAFT_63967 [Coccomyxa subellipsoidea C-169]EIE22842.1 hypothetical protein COCSUDRAFT_63967 [Coccomyxa subellipsoidea C-169]|eukprot:XP_005647386.1 hypothetical protein COCSUDRAFT_63967 [Coccomyxa subellipsoidea C-169]